MSELASRLDAHLPAPHRVPAALDRAWDWMEANGRGWDSEGGRFLTPYAGELDLSVSFGEPSLTGWFPAGTAGVEQIVPFGYTDGTGGMLAFWADGDTLRIVVLGSEGEAFVLVDDPVDLLRLVAIGYPELQTFYFAEPAEGEFGEDTSAAVADFRAWVEETFAVTVPETWGDVEEEDAFTTWVTERVEAARAANEAAAAAAPPPPAGARITGGDLGADAAAIVGLLGHADSAERIAAFLGLPDAEQETLRKAGIYVARPLLEPVSKGVTFYLQAEGGYPAYQRRAFERIEADFDAARIKEVLGEPFAEHPWGLIYQEQGEGSLALRIRVPEVGVEWVDVSLS